MGLPGVRVTPLRRDVDGWCPAGDELQPRMPVAFHVANDSGAVVHAAVVARGPVHARVLAARERLAPGARAVLGRTGRIVPEIGERLVVVLGTDRGAVGRLVTYVRTKRWFRPVAGVELVEYRVTAGPVLALGHSRDLDWFHPGSLHYIEMPGRSAARGAVPKKQAKRPAKPPPPTRSAYGRVDAPAAAVPGAEFPVVVGIAAAPEPGSTAPPMTIPDPRASGAYAIDVLLIAEGCRLRDGEMWRRTLRVTAEDPFPSIVAHLTVEPGGAAERSLQVLYSIAGATVGLATRTINVVAVADDVPPARAGGGLFGYALPPRYPVPDLTIRVTTDPTLPPGTLLWHVDSRHGKVPRWDRAIPLSIDGEPREFAARLMRDVNAHEGRPDLWHTLRGYGARIAERMPREVLAAVRAAAALAKGGVPRVLLLSAEPYVPWELALVDPPLDRTAAPFLGAQVALGRWVLGNHRPALPPPCRVAAAPLAVVTGVYDSPTLPRLEEAEAEAAALAKQYGAVEVRADLPSVLALLGGTPRARTLHFALHGKYDPTGTTDGLHLVDGSMLPPTTVDGSTLAAAPFVYLNACQVGTGNAVLGDYAGLAAAFLRAGASGVVAPLWKVDDTIAREMALRLYPAWFGRTPVGEALRRERGSVGAHSTSATPLAYQFFGHPALSLSGPRRPR